MLHEALNYFSCLKTGTCQPLVRNLVRIPFTKPRIRAGKLTKRGKQPKTTPLLIAETLFTRENPMQVDANTIRKGHVVDYNGKLWAVLKSEIMIPGKGAAVVQVEMRDVRTGVKTNVRFRTQETIERVQLQDQEMQFLFASGDEFTFMDQT